MIHIFTVRRFIALVYTISEESSQPVVIVYDAIHFFLGHRNSTVDVCKEFVGELV